MTAQEWSRRSAHGFTLLEVVVAMTIVGLGVVTLLQVFSSGLRLGARSSARTEAAAYGGQIMNELLSRPNLQDGSEQGTTETGSRWKLQVQPLKEGAPALGLSSNWELKEISLDAVVLDAGRERRVELKTLRLVRKRNP
jgi:prepilin-type N-terminal cleavage/methylation domain-containing protein